MRLPGETNPIQQMIETHLPHLSEPQLTGLVLWVCGAIPAGSACQNTVAVALTPWYKWNNRRRYIPVYPGGESGRQRRLLSLSCWRCGGTWQAGCLPVYFLLHPGGVFAINGRPWRLPVLAIQPYLRLRGRSPATLA